MAEPVLDDKSLHTGHCHLPHTQILWAPFCIYLHEDAENSADESHFLELLQLPTEVWWENSGLGIKAPIRNSAISNLVSYAAPVMCGPRQNKGSGKQNAWSPNNCIFGYRELYPQNNLLMWMTLFWFLIGENCGTEKFSNFHWVTQLLCDGVWTETNVMDLFSIHSH